MFVTCPLYVIEYWGVPHFPSLPLVTERFQSISYKKVEPLTRKILGEEKGTQLGMSPFGLPAGIICCRLTGPGLEVVVPDPGSTVVQDVLFLPRSDSTVHRRVPLASSLKFRVKLIGAAIWKSLFFPLVSVLS